MIPWTLGAAVVLAVPRLLRNDRSIFSAAMCATLLGASCFVASILLPDNTLRFIALAIGGPCLVLLNPCPRCSEHRSDKLDRQSGRLLCPESRALGRAADRKRAWADAGAVSMPRTFVPRLDPALDSIAAPDGLTSRAYWHQLYPHTQSIFVLTGPFGE